MHSAADPATSAIWTVTVCYCAEVVADPGWRLDPWGSKILMPRRLGSCLRSIPAVLCHPMPLADRHPLLTFCPQMIKGPTTMTSDQALDLLLRLVAPTGFESALPS
jgi:hypothetical protein